MEHKTIADFFNNLSAGEHSLFRSLSRVRGYAVSVLFVLCMATVYAQPKSQCVIESNNQGSILECDVSFTLLLTTRGGTEVSNVWNPESSVKDKVNDEFERFAEIWCNVTAANSRIREISVFTDGTNADFWLLEGSGIAQTNLAFPFKKPSSYIFHSDFGGGSHPYGRIMAHEFAHKALKIYDEYDTNIYRPTYCFYPLASHNNRNTLMGSGLLRRLRLSYSGDYPKGQDIQTAQFACYGKSAWEVITQSAYRDDPRSPTIRATYPRRDYFSRMNVDIPDAAQLEAAPLIDDFIRSNANSPYTCEAPTINWIPSTITTDTVSTLSNTVAVMIDHSASMGDDQRLSVAQRAAKEAIDLLYVEEMPVSVAIVGFDDVARTEIAPTRLDSIENLRMIKSSIDALTADGGTDYASALAHVQTVFAAADGGRQKVLIIISDGETDEADLDYFKTNKILVYTVELDTEAKVVLQDAITEARSRLNMEVDVQRLTSFLPSVLRDTSLIRNNQLTTSVSFESESLDDVVTTTTLISELSDSAHFILRWDEEASFGSFTLQSPNGAMIDQAYAARTSTDSISYLEGTSQAIYTIGSPQSGAWQVHISGGGHFEYETAVSSGIIAGINAGAELILQEEPSDVVAYPEPIPVLVHVGGVAPITDADVVAEVTMPDESTMSLKLLDDGNTPDEVEGDGLYSGMMADYSQDGICEIKVTVGNRDGRAMYDNTKLIHHSEDDPLSSYVPAEPEIAPLFQRVVYDQVNVINTKEKFMQMSGMPPMITTITSIPYSHSGSIERDDQVDWYQFNAMGEGERYYIQTSRLMPYPDADNTPMVTDLRLHGMPDRDEYIDRSIRDYGDASVIEWVAPRSGNYFISVAHAEQGRGYYGLTVSHESLSAAVQTTPLPCSATDIDIDDDGLIDICYLEGLNAIRNNPRGSGGQAEGCPSGGCNGYELMRDLDFLDDASYSSTPNKVNKAAWTVDDYTDNEDTGWQPISSFTSTFEGNNHTISNLMINRPAIDHVGLFGLASGSKIVNVGLLNTNIKGKNRVGGLVGYSSRSTISGNSASGRVFGGSNIGGLVGYSFRDSISSSSASGRVSGNRDYVGGLVGFSIFTTIKDSYASGHATGVRNIGGLAGYFRGDITNSRAGGDVEGNRNVGGLVGNSYMSTISGSSASGNATGVRDIGGLVGESAGSTISSSSASGRVIGVREAGGLVGRTITSDVADSYAEGDVEGYHDVGGLVGWNRRGSRLIRSRASGNVKGDGFEIGGLVGLNDASIVHSTATSNVTGKAYLVGGLVGFNQGDAIRGSIIGSHASGSVDGFLAVGGLVGINGDSRFSSEIIDSGASGQVIGRTRVGGLVGWNIKGTVAGNHANVGTGGKKDVGGLIGLNESDATGNRASGHVEGEENVGGLVGWNKSGTIADNYANAEVEGDSNVGGLIGFNESDAIGNRTSGDVEGEENVGGLVGRNKAAIADSTVASSVEGDNNVGGLIGFNEFDVTGNRASGRVKGEENVGGLVGWNKRTIDNSHASNIVTGDRNIGGLVGINEYLITHSSASGDVEGNNRVGGLVGINENKISIMNSYGSGRAVGNQDVGGLVGWHKGFITNCYASGDVAGEENVGGLVGLSGSIDLIDPSPIVEAGVITTSYRRGGVRGERNVGGLIGRDVFSDIHNSYWDITTGGIASDDAATGKTTEELQSPVATTGIYASWSSTDWDFGTAEQYPALKSTTLNTLLPLQRSGLLRLDLFGDLILLPNFRADIFNYRVIAANLSQFQLIPTAANAAADIVVSSADGFSTAVVSGTTSTDVPLNTNGATTIVIEVSAENENTVRYILNFDDNNFNEGERMILGNPSQDTNDATLTYRWTQLSGISLLSGVATDQALLDIKLPDDLIDRTSTTATAVFRLEISRSNTVIQSTDLLVTITKIDNSTIRLTSAPTLQALTLTAPQIDLAADSDGAGSLDVNSYRWQRRSGISADWAEIEGETGETYRLPDDAPRYGEYRVRFSYTDGQGYSKSLVSDVIIVATDIDKDNDGLIEISNLQELNAIRYQPDGSGYRVDKDAAKSTEGCADGGCNGYELTRDLDFNDDESYRVGAGWQPIGTDRRPFSGTFEGNGYTISNLRINAAYAGNVGLFGATGDAAEIDGVGLLNVDIIGRDNVGGLVGHKTGGTVSNSYVTGRVAGEGLYDVGGLVGWHRGGTITDSYTSSTVVAIGTNSGGLVGNNDNATITNSYALGSVVANENSGGLVGRNSGTITASHATGTVEGGGAVGGLVGQNSGIITNSHTTNAVTGGADVGGLAGWSSGDITNSYAIGSVAGNNVVGGFIGHNLRGTITNSYARGDVFGINQYIGGLVGWNGAGTITDSYARGDVFGQEDVGGLVGVNNLSVGKVGKSYAVGRVVGMEDVGGLVGENRGGTITKSYWNKTNNPTMTSAGGTSKTSVELQTPTAAGSTTTEIYYDWQSDDWDFASPTRYPLLRHAVGPDEANPACGTSDDLPICGTLLLDQIQSVGLLGLTLSAGATLSPHFDVAIYNYHVNAEADTEFLRIQFTARDTDARIRISTDGGFVADNASSNTRIPLNTDRATRITISVTAYGITSEYKLFVNRMPKIELAGLDTSVVIKEGKEYVIDVTVSDADISDVLSLSLETIDGGQDVVEVTTTTVTVSASGSVARVQQSLGIKGLKEGDTTLALTVRDEYGASATVLLTVTVEANETPTLEIKSPINQTIMLGSTTSIVVSVADANFDANDSVALEAVSSTSTVSVEPARFDEIRGDTDKTFVLTGARAGTAMISITATDNSDASVSKIVSVHVNAPPMIVNYDDKVTVKAGRVQSINVTVSDANLDDVLTLLLSATDDNPDIVELTTATVTVSANGRAERVSKSLGIEGLKAGDTMLTLTVRDEYGTSATAMLTVTVDANTAPTINGLSDIRMLTDTERALDVTLNDADDDVTRLKTRVVKSSNAEIATADIDEMGGATRVLTVSAGSMNGTATITVMVDDDREVANSVISEIFEVVVEANQAPMLTIKSLPSETIRLGSTASIIASVADANFDVNDSVDLEVVSLDSAVSVEPAGFDEIRGDTDKTFVLTATQAGTAMIRITATDSKDASVSKTVSVRVNTPPIVSQTIMPQFATIGQVFSLKASDFFFDEDGDTLRYEASGLPDSMTIGSTGTLVGMPVAGEESKDGEGLDVVLSVFDGSGASTQTTFTLFIDAETIGMVGINSEDTWRLQATAEADDANGIAEIKYQWYRREVGVALPTRLAGETSRTYTIADDQASRVAGTVYEISVSVTDKINRRVVLSAQHTVANEAPIIGTLAPMSVAEGDTIDASEAVSDANHDALSYRWEITDKADGSTVPAADIPLFVVPTYLVKPPAEATTLTLMLTVSDGRTDDVSTRVSVLVKRKNNGAAIPTVLIRDGQKLIPPTIDLSSDPDGAGTSATYVWQLCSANCSMSDEWSDIGEASDTATAYTIEAGQAGYRFRLKVDYIDGQGYENVIFYNSGIRIRAKVFLEGPLQ